VREIDLSDKGDLKVKLASPGYPTPVERALEFKLEAFDWNCPKYITERYTQADVQLVTQKMINRIAALETELAELRRRS